MLFVIFDLTGFCPLSIILDASGARELCKRWRYCISVRKELIQMPFYEYICEACGKNFVLLQSMTAKAEDTACPYCNEKKAKKMVSHFSSSGSGEHASCGSGGYWGGG